MKLADLIQEILDTHHALLRRELPRLTEAFEAMGADDRLMSPWRDFARLMDEHLMKEEEILFPRMKAMEDGWDVGACGLDGPLKQMRHEHEQIRALEADLRFVAEHAGAHQAALTALLDDLAVHARREDEELFPASEALAVSKDEADATIGEMPRAPDPTPRSEPAPPKRRGLRGRLKDLVRRGR